MKKQTAWIVGLISLLTIALAISAQANSFVVNNFPLLFDDQVNQFENNDTVIGIPENGAYMGVYTSEDKPDGGSQFTIEGRLYGIAEHEKQIYQTTQNTRRVAFDRQFYRWNDLLKDNNIHPYLIATTNLGRIPIVSLYTLNTDRSLPQSNDCDTSDGKVWQCIAAGAFDSHLTNIARKIHDSGIPKMGFSFVHEPEDEIRCDSNRGDECMGTAEDYVQAWRHLVSIFNQNNVTNVDFFWIVRDDIFGQSVPQGFPHADDIYPGDDVIDWIAADSYNYSFKSNGSYQWRSLQQVSSNFYHWAQTNHPTKPLAFAEWGTREAFYKNGGTGDSGEMKKQWFLEARQWLKNDGNKIKAIMYFNRFPSNEFGNVDEFGNTGPNWKVDTTPKSLEGYRALAQDSHFISAP